MDYQSNSLQNLTIKVILLLLVSLYSIQTYWAEAGKILFTYGKAEIKHVDQSIDDLAAKMPIQSGDEIITSINGRVQLEMSDKTIFDIQPNTVFMVEEYSFNQSVTPINNSKVEDNKSFYRLVRGGFRSISGLIGKRNKKNYRVVTPVATIGIRGTDYVAEFCESNCSAFGIGLYISVAGGGVNLQNGSGTLDVSAGSSAFVSSSATAPVITGKKSKTGVITNRTDGSLTNTVNGEDKTLVKTVNAEDGSLINIEAGINFQTLAPRTGIPGRGLIIAAGLSELSDDSALNVVINDNGTLEEIAFDQATFSIGSADTINQGYDPSTGLYWGRWADGVASVTTQTETSDIDLNSSNAHWIYTINTSTPVLPVSGTAKFNLIANTNPSDNMGNVGTLGTANLSADFTNQTVDADVTLEINQETWDASATDVALNGSSASFSGDFDSVVITEADGTAIDGSGSLQGFFTGDDSNAVSGAALGYSLEDNVDTTVEGVIAFEMAPEP